MISSRTPEGRLNDCPVCQKPICIEPSEPFGDATCPHCGTLLWFVMESPNTVYFAGDEAIRIRKRVFEVLAATLGVDREWLEKNPDRWRDLGSDSLDMVELVMELEGELK